MAKASGTEPDRPPQSINDELRNKKDGNAGCSRVRRLWSIRPCVIGTSYVPFRIRAVNLSHNSLVSLKSNFLAFVLRTFVALGAGFSVRIAEGSELARQQAMEEGRKSLPIYGIRGRCC